MVAGTRTTGDDAGNLDGCRPLCGPWRGDLGAEFGLARSSTYAHVRWNFTRIKLLPLYFLRCRMIKAPVTCPWTKPSGDDITDISPLVLVCK